MSLSPRARAVSSLAKSTVSFPPTWKPGGNRYNQHNALATNYLFPLVSGRVEEALVPLANQGRVLSRAFACRGWPPEVSVCRETSRKESLKNQTRLKARRMPPCPGNYGPQVPSAPAQRSASAINVLPDPSQVKSARGYPTPSALSLFQAHSHHRISSSYFQFRCLRYRNIVSKEPSLGYILGCTNGKTGVMRGENNP